MKHSNFEPLILAMKEQELQEFREAMKLHKGTYHFLGFAEISKFNQGEEVDDECCPHIYVNGGSNVEKPHELVVHWVQYDMLGGGLIRVYGRAFYENALSLSRDYQVEQGSWHDMMDYMNDPE